MLIEKDIFTNYGRFVNTVQKTFRENELVHFRE
jgi:hypothetical protein